MHLSMSSPRGGLGNPREFDGGVYPRVGILMGHHAFDLSILYSRREVNHLFLLILTILFRPGVGILIFFLENVKIPTLCPTPPPLGLDTDRCLVKCLENVASDQRMDLKKDIQNLIVRIKLTFHSFNCLVI